MIAYAHRFCKMDKILYHMENRLSPALDKPKTQVYNVHQITKKGESRICVLIILSVVTDLALAICAAFLLLPKNIDSMASLLSAKW